MRLIQSIWIALLCLVGAGAWSQTDDLVAKYKGVTLADFTQGAPGVTEFNRTPVEFQAAVGSDSSEMLIPGLTREMYRGVKLLVPGEQEPTREYAYGYLVRGSDVEQKWNALSENTGCRVLIKGLATYAGKDNWPYPVGIIMDSVMELAPPDR